MPKCLIFSIILFSTVFNIHAQQYWIEQPCPTSKRLTRLIFTDSLNGWAAGDSGVIIHTSNAGGSWLIQNTSTIIAIGDIFFVNSSTGWAIANDFLGHGTGILKTSNSGANWSNSIFSDSTLILYTIFFTDPLNGFLGGQSDTTGRAEILKTTNGGLTWKRCSIVLSTTCPGFPVLKINFANATTGFACGGLRERGGKFMVTTDGGNNWRDSCLAAEPLMDAKLISNSTIITIGGDPEFIGGTFYRSTDLGQSWQYGFLGASGIGMRIAERTPAEYWIPCNGSGQFAVSVDSANSWFAVNAPDSCYVYDTYFTSQYNGWSIGCKDPNLCYGMILKYNTDIIGIEPKNPDVPLIPVLYQNYPNPFNPVTTIKYDIPAGTSPGALVRVTVYDLLGKEVIKLVEGFKQPGSYSVNFDGSNLASGIYFYEMKINNGIDEIVLNKKMVLIK
jgi:photosystem II stability/assembly factor-like uncharacterized protein